jgi:hypothetical protein
MFTAWRSFALKLPKSSPALDELTAALPVQQQLLTARNAFNAVLELEVNPPSGDGAPPDDDLGPILQSFIATYFT